MKKILLAALIIFGLFCLPVLADDCPRPKVGLYGDIEHHVFGKTSVYDKLNKDYEDNKTNETWATEIQQHFLAALRQNNPDVDFVDGTQDCDYLFEYKVTVTRDPEPDEDTYDPTDWYWGTYYGVWSILWSSGKCGANLNINVGETQDGVGADIFGLIDANVGWHLNMALRIKRHEREHPVPPRAPTMKIRVKPEYVSPIEGKRKTKIRAKVKNCEGLLVHDPHRAQNVYYKPRKIERGRLKACAACPAPSVNIAAMEKNMLVVGTKSNGEAVADFELKKGVEAETVNYIILTCGRVSNFIRQTATLKIKGLEIEVKPERKQVYHEETTKIHITLNEVTPEGEKEPVEGKTLKVVVSGIVNGKLTPKQKAFTTDARGRITLTYKAGDNDGKINIRATFRPNEWPDEVKGSGTIIVKPPQYDAAITIRKKASTYIQTQREDTLREKECVTRTKRSYQLNETIEGAIYIQLKLIQSADNPLFGQRMEYYQPVHVNISDFNVSHIVKRYDYSNSSTPGCAQGGYEAHTHTVWNKAKHEIKHKDDVTRTPWILVFDKKTKKPLKLLPAGYPIDYDINEVTKFNSESWSDDGRKSESKTDTKDRHKTFAVGPVEDPIKDPTTKSSEDWLRNYAESQGMNIPKGIPIPKVDNKDAIKEIPPDIIVTSGDGKNSFGGRGTKTISEVIEDGTKRQNLDYSWQMTRRLKK